ncbi:MAG: hypothetical protein GY940_26610, partial [bacterium]|nr:hypothetical protein [bacterium]
LSYNRFSGGIPSWIGDLENLEELILDGNQLQGPISGGLGRLAKLTVLRIGHNGLAGKIPATIAKLTGLMDNRCNFKWNALYTDNESLRTFLKKKQSGKDWESSQTIAPAGITAVSPAVTSMIISWQPVAYTADGGGYQVFYGTDQGGPHTPGSTIDDKTVTQLEVKGLEKSTTYYFVVKSWTARHGSNRNRVESADSLEISSSTRGTTISGTVKTSQGQGVPGVELEASGSGGKAVGDSRGNYHLSVTPGWSGTVTPAKRGYDFSPPTLEYSNVNADLEGENYTAEANTKISGKVTDLKGKGLGGITLTFSDNIGTATAVTDETGNYIHTVTYGWKGTVTPAKPGYKFDPISMKYDGVISAEAGKKYKAFRPPEIGGRVKTRRGRGTTGVTLTFSDRGKTADTKKDEPVTTNERGEYAKKVPENWAGRVTPVKPGYKFYPAKKEYKNMTLDSVKIAENFRVELDLKFFISVMGNYLAPSEESFSDIYGSGVFFPGIKAGYKFYRGVYLWGGYDVSTKNGASLIFNEPAKWKESFLSGGLGYNGNLSIHFGYKVEIGISHIRYTEEAFGKEFSGNANGVNLAVAGIFKISDRLFTEITIGYVAASDSIEELSRKLGGPRAGIGLGIRF